MQRRQTAALFHVIGFLSIAASSAILRGAVEEDHYCVLTTTPSIDHRCHCEEDSTTIACEKSSPAGMPMNEVDDYECTPDSTFWFDCTHPAINCGIRYECDPGCDQLNRDCEAAGPDLCQWSYGCSTI